MANHPKGNSTKRTRSETESVTVSTGKGKGKAVDGPPTKKSTPTSTSTSINPNTKKAPLKSALKKKSTTSTVKASPLTSTKAVSSKNTQQERAEAEAEATIQSDSELIKGLSDISDDEIGDSDDEDQADSSDEDEEHEEENKKVGKHSEILTMKLPNSKDDKAVKARLDKLKSVKSKKGLTSTPGVLYLGRLPNGFQESEMKSYFSQFGEVSRLRLSRNKKTGKTKHYAFIEFADQDVSVIVQETMNNYLIDGHLLQVRVVPAEKVHSNLWIGANRKFRKVPNDRKERVKHDGDKTVGQRKAVEKKLLKRQEERREKLKEMGIDYEFEGYTK